MDRPNLGDAVIVNKVYTQYPQSQKDVKAHLGHYSLLHRKEVNLRLAPRVDFHAMGSRPLWNNYSGFIIVTKSLILVTLNDFSLSFMFIENGRCDGHGGI